MLTQFPDFLTKRLLAQYGKELTEQIEYGCRQRRPVTMRVNTLKASREQVCGCLESAGIRYSSPGWYSDALILEDVRESAVRALPVYEKGEVYLQSLSSMIPPLLLDPGDRECILDMTAAPGGKTTQMAALSGNRAQITACEKNKARSERLRFNLERQGANRVLVMQEDARRLDPLFSFDKILLDAPCSGSGTLTLAESNGALALTENGTANATQDGPACGAADSRPSGQERIYFTEELIERSVRTQEALLRKALSLLKPGGEMVYSTCSILAGENEELLKRVLPQMKSRIVPIEHPMLSELPLLPVRLPGVCCIRPTDRYEGFFVARIRK